MNRTDLAARFRIARPMKLRVVLNDETEKPVAMPRGRNRWDRAAAMVDSLPWASVYPLDGQGSICAEAIHRDDAAPATDLEEVPKNPTMMIVHAVMSNLAPVLRDVHKVATTSALDLVAKVRQIHRDELKDMLEGYKDLLGSLSLRANEYESRANQLLAENDQLRDEVAAMRQHQHQGGNSEAMRDRIFAKALGVDLGADDKPPEGQSGGGGNGA